jgi:hypothetical protein
MTSVRYLHEYEEAKSESGCRLIATSAREILTCTPTQSSMLNTRFEHEEEDSKFGDQSSASPARDTWFDTSSTEPRMVISRDDHAEMNAEVDGRSSSPTRKIVSLTSPELRMANISYQHVVGSWSGTPPEPRMVIIRHEQEKMESELDVCSSATPTRKSCPPTSSEPRMVNRSSYHHDFDGHCFETWARKSWTCASSEPRMVATGYEQKGWKQDLDVYGSAASCGNAWPRALSEPRMADTRYQHEETKSEVGGYYQVRRPEFIESPGSQPWCGPTLIPTITNLADESGESRPECNTRPCATPIENDSWSCDSSLTSRRDTLRENQAQWDFELSETLARQSSPYTQVSSMMNNRYENEEVTSDFDLLVPPLSQAWAHTLPSTKVSFGTVNVHTHEIALGDREIIGSECFGVDEFEKMHEGRARKASRISGADREALLRGRGYSTECFDRVLREILQIQVARREAEQEVCRLQNLEARLEITAQQILLAEETDEQADEQANTPGGGVWQGGIIYQNEPIANMQTAYRGEVQPEYFSPGNYQEAQGGCKVQPEYFSPGNYQEAQGGYKVQPESFSPGNYQEAQEGYKAQLESFSPGNYQEAQGGYKVQLESFSPGNYQEAQGGYNYSQIVRPGFERDDRSLPTRFTETAGYERDDRSLPNRFTEATGYERDDTRSLPTRFTNYRAPEEYEAPNTRSRSRSRKNRNKHSRNRSRSQSGCEQEHNKKGLRMEEYQKHSKSTRKSSRSKSLGAKASAQRPTRAKASAQRPTGGIPKGVSTQRPSGGIHFSSASALYL